MSDSYTSQARIGRAGAADETIGCGLLVTPRHIVTCAHVVASALGTEDTTTAEAPADLPLLTPPFRTTGQVIRWLPMREVGEEEKKRRKTSPCWSWPPRSHPQPSPRRSWAWSPTTT